MKWQPIETAPKDGTAIILGRVDNYAFEGFWMDDPNRNYRQKIGWFFSDYNIACMPENPTHWMPLPDPPQEETPDDKEATWGGSSMTIMEKEKEEDDV